MADKIVERLIQGTEAKPFHMGDYVKSAYLLILPRTTFFKQ